MLEEIIISAQHDVYEWRLKNFTYNVDKLHCCV